MISFSIFPDSHHPWTGMVRVHHAAKTIGCSDRTVRRMIQKGELDARRVGRRQWAIPRSGVELLRNQKELSC